MGQPKQLFLLQQLDTQLDSSQARLKEIEAALNDNSVLQRAKAQADKAQELLNHGKLSLKHAEQDVEAQQTKISNNERALYGGAITNPKELEDLQMESGALKRHLSTLEDRMLEEMLAAEEAQRKMDAAQSHLEESRKKIAEENTDLTAEQTELSKKVEQLSKQRETLAPRIDQESMEIYQSLRKSKAGIAVAEVLENSCAACGANLSAALAQAARSPNKIATCDACHRILYSN